MKDLLTLKLNYDIACNRVKEALEELKLFDDGYKYQLSIHSYNITRVSVFTNPFICMINCEPYHSRGDVGLANIVTNNPNHIISDHFNVVVAPLTVFTSKK